MRLVARGGYSESVLAYCKPRKPQGRPIRMMEDLVLAAVLQAVVACDQGLTLTQFFSRRRDLERVRARHIAIALIDRMTTLSTGQIGDLFGFDHTSIIHAINRVASNGLMAEVDRLERLLCACVNNQYVADTQ